ncbi:MAG TPA: hypothetical protein PKD53_16095, partial [Chloroflexaceae bacterium]|nr:hypothetical protein [Chloroflexaceae bacterium]
MGGLSGAAAALIPHPSSLAEGLPLRGELAPGALEVAGPLAGIAERRELLPRDDVAAGDRLIGVRSSGPHT